MKNIEIKGENGEYYIPNVIFDSTTGVCELSGESFLEDTEKFYGDLEGWIDQYIKEVKGPLTFNFKLAYFNTSSSAAILNLLKQLKNYKQDGGEVQVNWYYESWDVDTLYDVEDFIFESGLKINMIAI